VGAPGPNPGDRRPPSCEWARYPPLFGAQCAAGIAYRGAGASCDAVADRDAVLRDTDEPIAARRHRQPVAAAIAAAAGPAAARLSGDDAARPGATRLVRGTAGRVRRSNRGERRR